MNEVFFGEEIIVIGDFILSEGQMGKDIRRRLLEYLLRSGDISEAEVLPRGWDPKVSIIEATPPFSSFAVSE